MPSNGRFEAVYNRDYIQDIAAQNEAISRAYWRPHNAMLAPLIAFYFVIGCLFVALADGVLKPIVPDQQMAMRVAMSVVFGGLLAYIVNSFWFDPAWNAIVSRGLTRQRSAGDMRVRFDEAGITWTAVDSETFVAWPGIERIALRDNAVVFYNTPNAHIIPRVAFGTDADLARTIETELLPRLMTVVREATEADGAVRALFDKSTDRPKRQKQSKRKRNRVAEVGGPEAAVTLDTVDSDFDMVGDMAMSVNAGPIEQTTLNSENDLAFGGLEAADIDTLDVPPKPRVFGRAPAAVMPAKSTQAISVQSFPVETPSSLTETRELPAFSAHSLTSPVDDPFVFRNDDAIANDEPLGFGPPVMAPPVFGKIPSRAGSRPQASAAATFSAAAVTTSSFSAVEAGAAATIPAPILTSFVDASPVLTAPVVAAGAFGQPSMPSRSASIIPRSFFGVSRPATDDRFSDSDLLTEPPFMAQARSLSPSVAPRPATPSLTFDDDFSAAEAMPAWREPAAAPAPGSPAAKAPSSFWPAPSSAWQALSGGAIPGGRKPKLVALDASAPTADMQTAHTLDVHTPDAEVGDAFVPNAHAPNSHGPGTHSPGTHSPGTHGTGAHRPGAGVFGSADAAFTPRVPDLADWPDTDTGTNIDIAVPNGAMPSDGEPAFVGAEHADPDSMVMHETVVQAAPAGDLGYWRLSKRRVKGRKGHDGEAADF